MVRRLNLATCNIRHGVPWGRSHTQVLVPWLDNRRLVRRVGALAADVMALQEVDRGVARSWWTDQAGRCAAGLGATAVFGPARCLGPGGRYGNALLVWGEVLASENVRLQSVGEPRSALFARVRLGGGPTVGAVTRDAVTRDAVDRDAIELTAVSTHLQNRCRDRPDEAVGQLRELLGRLSAWPEPWVVMGDLNLGPDRVGPVLASAGLDGAVTGPTQPTDRPRARIDWIATRGLELCGARVSEVVVADHRAVTAEVVTA